MREKSIFAAIAALVVFSVPAAAQYNNGGHDNRGYDNGYGRGEGFYREQRDRTVYYQYDRNRYCGVQNEEQMKMLGGFKQVNIVNRLRLQGRNTGACQWPNGFYRRDNGPEVYMLEGYGSGQGGGRICAIGSPQQLRQLGGNKSVKVIPGNSNLEAGRGRIRPC